MKLGELDEEFVYESGSGDRFMLGSFGWRVVRQDKDSVIGDLRPGRRRQTSILERETKGGLGTSLAFWPHIRESGEGMP